MYNILCVYIYIYECLLRLNSKTVYFRLDIFSIAMYYNFKFIHDGNFILQNHQYSRVVLPTSGGPFCENMSRIMFNHIYFLDHKYWVEPKSKIPLLCTLVVKAL